MSKENPQKEKVDLGFVFQKCKEIETEIDSEEVPF